MTSLLASLALLPSGWTENVRVTLDDSGVIHSVIPNAQREDTDEALGDLVLLPAPSNLHSHAFQRIMAGAAEQRGGGDDSFWSWRELMYHCAGSLTPEQIEAIAALAYVEMLEAGYAAVAEFHYLHHQPGGDPYDNVGELSSRIFAAARTAGIGLTHLPVLYQRAGVRDAPLEPRQRRFSSSLDNYARIVEGARTLASSCSDFCVGIAPHSLRAVGREDLHRATRQLAGAGPIHIHIAEQEREVSEVRQAWGARPVEWLLDHEDVGDRWCLVHATHLTEAEVCRFAQSGAVAGLCPLTEANLGDGIFAGPAFLEAGGRWGVGTDSNVRISLARELELLEYGQRLERRSRNVLRDEPGSVGRALFDTACQGGAQALARRSGRIESGYWADLLALAPEALRAWDTHQDRLLDAWIFAGSGHDNPVREVWSAGRHMVSSGRHQTRDAVETELSRVLSGFRLPDGAQMAPAER